MLLSVQTFHFFKLCKNAKSAKSSTILKNDGQLRILNSQISLNQYSNICKNIPYFFYYVGGGKVLEDFRKAIQFEKN